MTLTRRTVITLQEVIKLIHAGFRCPDSHCPGHQRTYRSPEADALALPGFPLGWISCCWSDDYIWSSIRRSMRSTGNCRSG